jgi:anthranilate phosphoribosyltransferase
VIGVPSIGLAEKIVPALIKLGSGHALVVHGLNGMDEISITGESLIWEVENGETVSSRRSLSPEDFGLTRAVDGFIGGGTPEQNAQTILHVLSGARGPQRDIVVMNAAAALVASNRAETFPQGAQLAQTTIDKGQALTKLNQLIEFTCQLAGN